MTTISVIITTYNSLGKLFGTVDFNDVGLIFADEAHHINSETRDGGRQTTLNFNTGENNDETTNWEQTVMRIFKSHEKNMLLEFTATADLTNPFIAEKYYDKIIFDYPLKRFR